MREIRVELRDFDDKILGDIDIISSDDFPLSLTFQNFDVRSLDSRGGSFSKTFKVPATKKNNKLFNHIYQSGNTDKKTVRKDIPACIYSNNVPILYGKLRVSKVIKGKKPIEYDCIFLGDNMDWANSIKNLDLKDLRFSSTAYDNYSDISDGTGSSYAFTNVQDLQENPDNPFSHSGYVKNHDKLVFPLLSVGEGVSPKDNVTDLEFVPCLYLKNVWDKVFQAQGYEVESTFCESDYFKSLLIPLNFERTGEQINTRGGKITKTDSEELVAHYFYDAEGESQDDDNEARAAGSPEINSRFGSVDSSDIDSNLGLSNTQFARYVFRGNESEDAQDETSGDADNGNVQAVQSPSDGMTMLVVNESGSHEISWNINTKIGTTEFANFSGDTTIYLRLRAEIWRTEMTDTPNDLYWDSALEAQTREQGSRLMWTDVVAYDISDEASPAFFNVNFSGSFNTQSTNTSESYIFTIMPEIEDYPNEEGGILKAYFVDGTFEVSGSNEYSIGEDITDVHHLLPRASQADFIIGTAQMFNLQFRTDAAEKKVYIEPYDHFYNFDKPYDWTDKIDYSKNISEEFIYDIKSKLEFKYKDASNDGFIERFNKRNDVDYGSYEELDNTGQLIDGITKYENKFFSPSFNFLEPDYIDDTQNNTSAVNIPFIPLYHTEASDLNNSVTAERAEKSFDIGSRVLLLNAENTNESGTARSVAYAGESGGTQKYHKCVDNVLNGSSALTERYPKAFFNNPCVSIKNTSTGVYTDSAGLSIGTYNGVERFVDQNLSYGRVKFKGAFTSGSQLVVKQYTLDGLFHTFFSLMIAQLRAKPRLKTMNVNLTYADICNLDFRKLVFIDGVYHRINKIIDFKPHLKESTKIELQEFFDLGQTHQSFGNLSTLDLTNIHSTGASQSILDVEEASGESEHNFSNLSL